MGIVFKKFYFNNIMAISRPHENPHGSISQQTSSTKALVASLGATVALLITPPVSAEHRTDNRAYIGITIPFGDGKSHIPQIVVGAQSLKVDTSDTVVGGEVSARLNAFGGSKDDIFVDSLRVGIVGGNRDVQGIVGGGYSFTDNEPLLSGAIQGPYVRGTADYVLNKGLGFSIEANTLKKPREVDKKAAGSGGAIPTCPPGTVLLPNGDCV
jgi:hypothetical protein